MPSRQLSPHTKSIARQLRAEMTDAERRLWYSLRRHGMGGRRFRRQHPIGPFILDFYCVEARLVVEVDGGQHFEQAQMPRDGERTRYLKMRGLRVLRFTNLEVLKETEAVLDVILRVVEEGSGVGSPSP